MGIGHRLVATLGFVVPAALAAWITLGVDAHAAPPDLRPLRFQQHAAYRVEPRTTRWCEPSSDDEFVCDCVHPILEVEIAADRLCGAIYAGDGPFEPRFVVPRTSDAWNALRHWLALQRRQPIYDGHNVYKVIARPGVPYRDIIRVLELADQAGFTTPQVVASRAAEVDRPGPLRITVAAGGVGADFDGPFPAHLPFVEGDRAWRVLATWLADRRADPRLDANDLAVVIEMALGARPRDVALATLAIEGAGYRPSRISTSGASPYAIPLPPTARAR